MSKVSLAGNASGTGIFTIASPNSNTDRTLTLPDATGTVQVSGNPISGTTGTFTGLLDISASGAGQIKFPASANASANANTLDDYEEGTWTPILQTDGSGVFTQTTQLGTYTKVGNLVSFSLYIVWSAYSGSGSASLTNWPFSIYWGASSVQRQYAFLIKTSNSTFQNYQFKNDTNGYVNNSYLYTPTDSSIVAASSLGSSGWLTISGQYFTNT
jgi:hypothetical protein